MRGFVYLDVLFASLLALVALVIGMQLISNIVTSDHSKFSNLGESVLSVSNRVIYTCPENGGIADCDIDYVHVGTIDESVWLSASSYKLPDDVLRYGADNNHNFSITFDNNYGKGVYCLTRLLKRKNANTEVRVHICGE